MTADSQQGDKREWHTFEQNIPQSLLSDYDKLKEGLDDFYPGGACMAETTDAMGHHRFEGMVIKGFGGFQPAPRTAGT
jgi:hypothetical protein